MTAPIEMGVTVPGALPGDRWCALARRVEDAGFTSLHVPDHLAPRSVSPLVATMAALSATTTLRAGPLVLNNELRHPAMVAREAVSIALLSGGRFELGLGAGYGRSAPVSDGCPPRSVRERVDRLDEAVGLIRRTWEGGAVDHAGGHYRVDGLECAFAPEAGSIPILIGGNGRRTLEVAARRGDVVGFIGVSPGVDGGAVRPTHLTHRGLAEQIQAVCEAADAASVRPARSVLIQDVVITDDRRGAAAAVQRWMPASVETILDSPYFLIGSVQQVVEQLHRLRDEFGVARATVFVSSLDAMVPVLERLG